ncbi:MAG TPA: hypothetical protein VKN99_07535 [Polyangia bacterium]|nr:hypothetical protein [Polyangia bacterium]
MEAKRSRYFSIGVEDKPGELAKFAKRLKDAGVNLAGLWGFGMGAGKGQFMAVPEDAAKFKKALEGSPWKATEQTCFYVTGEDRVGALCEILDRVAGAGINLQAVDGIGLGGRCGAYLWTDPKDVEKVAKILKV